METDTSTPVKCTHDNESSGITPEQKNAKIGITSSSTDTSIEDNKQTDRDWEKDMFTKLFEKIDDLNTRYKELDSKFDEMIKSNDYVSKQFEEAQKKIKEISTKEASMEANICDLQRKNMLLHQINNNLLYLVLKLKTHQRRLNLVIEGIKEQYRENEDTLLCNNRCFQ